MNTPDTPPPDDDLAERVIAATGPGAHPRLAAIMPSLVRHLHAFAREVNLTVSEWAAGVELINECGRLSTNRRNETQLLCDILGLESLVDEITANLLATSSSSSSSLSTAPTPSAVLGPFYRAGAPETPNGGSIVRGFHPASAAHNLGAETLFVSGRVLDAASGEPIPGAQLDVWHAAPNGLYEQQDPSQADMNLRGRLRADAASGRYAFATLRPAPYPIPTDGPAGRVLALLDRGGLRPAHVHFLVSASGYRTLTTQLFDARDGGHVADDAVFAVKDALLVDIAPGGGGGEDRGNGARWRLRYDFALVKEE